MNPEPAEQLRQRPLLLTLGLAAFVVSLDGRVVAPLLPAIAEHFDTSIARASWFVSAYMLPYGLCQLAYGPVADRFGKVRVAAFAMVAFSVCTALCGAFESFTQIVALRALTGAAAAALIPLTIAYIGDTVPYARRQAALSMLMASSGAAQALGIGVGGLIASVTSWRGVFPVLGALAALATTALFMFRARELRPAPSRATQRPGYREVLRAPGMARLLALVASEGFLFMGGSAFLSGLLEQRFQMGVLEIGLVLGSAGLSQLLSARAMPRLLTRYTEAELLMMGGTAMASCFLISAVANHFAWVFVGCLLSGVGFTTCHSTLQTRATEAFPRGRGSALALFAFSLFSGGSIGTVVLAQLSRSLGYGTTFAVVGLLLLAFTLGCARTLGLRPALSAGE